METIKISVEVSVNLSENTQKFLTSLFGNATPLPDVPCIIIYPKERDEITNPFSENKLQDLCRTPVSDSVSCNLSPGKVPRVSSN